VPLWASKWVFYIFFSVATSQNVAGQQSFSPALFPWPQPFR